MSSAFEASQQALERVCQGNAEAAAFLVAWATYVHEIDDIIDGERSEPERILRTFARAAELYSLPFYLKNIAALRQIVLNCTNAYADSVLWEHSPIDWRRQFADHYRHFGAEMVLAVANLVGGYEHMRSISPELRAVCWNEHHDRAGNPV